LILAHVRQRREHEDRHLDAPLAQHARDDEPVAAVVAPAREDGDAAAVQIVERRGHGGHNLAAGVLHQHDGGDADLVDRPPIRLSHLLGCQDAHVTSRGRATLTGDGTLAAPPPSGPRRPERAR
jgi:hypothetical protein